MTKREFVFFNDKVFFNIHVEQIKALGINVIVYDELFEYKRDDRYVIGQMYTVERLNDIQIADVIRFEHFEPKHLEKFHACVLVSPRSGEVWIRGNMVYTVVKGRWISSENNVQNLPRTYNHNFEVGDIVKADRNTPLHCGSGIYTHAIVVKTEPPVLVSEEADMRWESTVKDLRLEVVGKAPPEVVERCMRRLNQ